MSDYDDDLDSMHLEIELFSIMEKGGLSKVMDAFHTGKINSIRIFDGDFPNRNNLKDLDSCKYKDLDSCEYVPLLIQLLDTLKQTNRSLESLHFSCLYLASKEIATAIYNLLLVQPKVKALALSHCHLSLEAARLISAGIKTSPSEIELFDLCGIGSAVESQPCKYDDIYVYKPVEDDMKPQGEYLKGKWMLETCYAADRNNIAKVLVDSVIQHGNLKELNLFLCGLDDETVAEIAFIINMNYLPLESIHLEGNVVGPRAAKALADLLSRTTTLTTMYLYYRCESKTVWKDAPRIIVEEGLKNNRVLEEFYMDGSDISMKFADSRQYLERNKARREAMLHAIVNDQGNVE